MRTVFPVADDADDAGEIWLRRALLLWIILTVAVTVKTVVQRERHMVYPIFAAASRHWWADLPIHGRYEGLDCYMYSPTLAIALTPLAVLPIWLGGSLWNIVSIGLLVWSLRRLVRDVLPGEWPPWREGLFLGLTMVASVRGVWSGHSNALLLALVLFGLSAIARRRWWTAAWLLAMPAFIKIWPLAIALLLAARWPRQLAGRLCATVAALAAMPFLTRPFHIVCGQYAGWYVSLQNMASGRRNAIRDFWTFTDSYYGPVDRSLCLIVLFVTAAAVLGWCLWQARQTTSTRRLLTAIFSMWLAWQLLFGPGSERLTYLLIAPAMSWAVMTSYEEKRLRTLSTAVWLMVFLLTTSLERAVMPLFPASPIILPLAVVLFAAWLVIHERATDVEEQLSAGAEIAGHIGPPDQRLARAA